jgi:hypothetical protein
MKGKYKTKGRRDNEAREECDLFEVLLRWWTRGYSTRKNTFSDTLS